MKLYELVSISPGFHRSINLKYDLGNEDKIRSYIPTEKAEAFIRHFAECTSGLRNDGASMLIGSYGTGKSHLAAVLGTLVGKMARPSTFEPILEKMRDSEAKELLCREVAEHTPFLVVPVSWSANIGLDRQLLLSLKASLANVNLDVRLRTAFDSALSRIEEWRREFPETYARFTELLDRHDKSVVDFSDGLRRFDSDELELFVRLYPQLTSGSQFESYSGNAAEVYEDACVELGRLGYRGIIIIYDEFNKMMESSSRDGLTLKTLQDMAELASRPLHGTKVHVMLVSHKTIGQYTNQIHGNLVDEWRKIEGRFRVFDLSIRPWEGYDLMSRVLRKSSTHFFDSVASMNPLVREAANHRRLNDLFDGIPKEFVESTVIRECIPLHPVTVFMLPRVSAKVAQNERTLFTFMAGEDNSPIRQALAANVEDDFYVRPWQMFDYFEGQLRRSQDEEIKAVWLKVTNAIESLAASEAKEARLLKTIGMFLVTNSPAYLPCTREMLAYALGSAVFEEAMVSLQAKKLVYVSQATEEVQIVEPTEIDLEEEIERWMTERCLDSSPLSALCELGIQHFVLPHGYNYEQKMTRFLQPVYADRNTLARVFPNRQLSNEFDNCDGVVCFLFPENHREISELKSFATECADSRVVFVVPEEPIMLGDSLLRLLALNNLKQSIAQKSNDPRVQRLVSIYLDDAIMTVKAHLEKVTRPSDRVSYYWKGNLIDGICSDRSLSALASSMMTTVYCQTPIVNNELINKHAPTATSRRARNEVIDAILSGVPDIRSSLRSSQEEFMLDTLFLQTGLLSEDGTLSDGARESFKRVLSVIHAFFLSSQNEPKRFDELTRQLISPPFGIRKGILPAILTVAVAKYHKMLSIRDESGSDVRIDASLLEKITESPEAYWANLNEWNEAKEILTQSLIDLFSEGRIESPLLANECQDLADSMFRWYSSLPRLARETKEVSNSAAALRRCARIAPQRPKEILLRRLPSMLGFPEYDLDNVNEVGKLIRQAKDELDGKLMTVLRTIKAKVQRILSRYGVPGESLLSLAKNAAESVDRSGPPSIEWAKFTACVAGFISYDENQLVYELAQALSGVRLEDWLDETYSGFLTLLGELERTREQIATTESVGPRVDLLFVDSVEKRKRVTIHECEVSELGKVLQAHLESSISNFGQAINVLEKRQILINILRQCIEGDNA